MAYGELIRIGDNFDGDSQLSTTIVKSDPVNVNGKVVEVQIKVIGSPGDSDDVEVYQFNSLASDNAVFDTEGKSLGIVTLDGDTEVVKSFNCFICRSMKIGLKMQDTSLNTPFYKGAYTINSEVDNYNFD